MALETGTYISDLNIANPAAADGIVDADNHFRLLKSTIKATFPNITGIVLPTQVELNYVDGVTSAIQTQIDAKASTASVALKADLASPTFTGVPAAPTAAPGTNTTQVATTAFMEAGRVILAAATALKADIASPTFTGTPAAPTPSPGDNDTSIATTAFVTAAIAAGTSGYPPGLLYGLGMSNAADTVNDITVATGKARDEADSGNIVLASAITKQIDAAWAVGTNLGGLNTGTVANGTWYEIHLIKRVDTGVVDVMFTTTANRATLPTNYTLQRRIGWVRYGTATLLQFTQVNDHFTWTTQVNDVSASVLATAAAATLTVPPNAVARFRASLEMSTTGASDTATIVFSEIAEGDVTPATSTGIASLTTINGSAVATKVAGHFELRVDSSSQIEHDGVVGSGDGATIDISTFGFIDSRLRLG